MKKNLMTVMAVLAGAVVLTACSGGGQGGGTTDTAKTQATAETGNTDGTTKNAEIGAGDSGSASSSMSASGAETDLEPQEGGILNIGLAGSPKNLDPKNRTSVYESSIISQICDTLIIYSNDQSEYLPSLAKKWEISEDGKEYTFYLRDDVHFQKGQYQDGRILNANDVKYSLERAKEAKNVTLVMLDHCEVLDDFTVKCVLNESNAIFLDALTGPTNVIIPQEEVEGWGDSFGEHLIGSGPFKLVEFKLDQQTTVERNEDYWGPRPNLDGACFKVITDINQQVNGLKTGEIDFSTKISGEAVQMVQEDSNLVLLNQPNTSINMIGFNTEKGITSDVKVRQALAEAVDIEDLCVGLYKYGEAVYAGQPMPPASWGYDPSMDGLKQKYDPEHAKQLLTEAGYPDGFKISINFSNSTNNTKLATILQQYWKQNLNVDLEIIGTEWAVYSQAVTQGDHDIYVVGISSTVDPHNFTGKCLGSQYIGTLPAGARLNNPEMDALIQKSLETSDQAERKEIYKDIVKKAMELCPAIYFSNDNITWGTTTKVHGLCQKTYWNLCNSEVNVWMEQ